RHRRASCRGREPRADAALTLAGLAHADRLRLDGRWRGTAAGGRMIPGELLVDEGELDLNPGRRTLTLVVANSGERPIQVGSHYHFAETNAALRFDRAAARGMRLNIASGTAVRFEPGQQRTVELVDFGGARQVWGFRAQVQGAL